MPRKKTARFKCPKCGQAFAMAMHLGRHMTSTHGRAPKKSATPAKASKAVNVGPAEQLGSLIARLQSQRQEHVDAIAEIDASFARFGITPVQKKRRGRPPGRRGRRPGPKPIAKAAPKARRRKRRQFKVSGLKSVLAFVKAAGKTGRTTAEINKHWKGEKRSGNAYITIGQLVKAKQLKKEELKGQKGSRYTAA